MARWCQGRSKATGNGDDNITKSTSESSFKINTRPARPWLRPDHGVQDQQQAYSYKINLNPLNLPLSTGSQFAAKSVRWKITFHRFANSQFANYQAGYYLEPGTLLFTSALAMQQLPQFIGYTYTPAGITVHWLCPIANACQSITAGQATVLVDNERTAKLLLMSAATVTTTNTRTSIL